jgi:aryl-alcohol dehydrogenase-like predicted oxidoreductase
MKAIPFGSVDLSRVCLGTMDFGTKVPKEQAFRILDLYIGQGGNFLDTAHIYASWVPGGEGASERLLGEWLKAAGMRDRVYLATKGAHPPLDNMALSRCSREEIRQDLAESLDRLGTSSIDLYWLHRDDPERPVEEIIETLDEIQREGLIGSYGASNWSWRQIGKANEYAQKSGLSGFSANQPGWAWAENPQRPASMRLVYMDEETHAFHTHTGLPVVPYSPQAKGFFGKENAEWAKGGFQGTAPRAANYDTPANRQCLLRAIELAEKQGCTPNQIALAYLLSQPFPVYPIIGTGNPEHLLEAMGAAEVMLNGDDRCRLIS